MCVLGSICLTFFLLRDVFERLKCYLDPWLSCLFDCIHVCVFLFLKNCFWAILTAPRHLAYLSSSSTSFYCNLDSSSIHQESFCLLDRCSIAPWSIEPFLLWIPLDSCPIDASVKIYEPRHLSICWDLRDSIYRVCVISYLISSISLDCFVSFHLPNLSLTLKLFPKCSSVSRSILFCGKTLSHSFLHAFHLLWPNFWVCWKIWGFSKSKRFLQNFGMGFVYLILKHHALHHMCIITLLHAF